MNPRARPPPLRIITIASNLAQTFSTFFPSLFWIWLPMSVQWCKMSGNVRKCEKPNKCNTTHHALIPPTSQRFGKLEKMESICSGIRDKFRVKSQLACPAIHRHHTSTCMMVVLHNACIVYACVFKKFWFVAYFISELAPKDPKNNHMRLRWDDLFINLWPGLDTHLFELGSATLL